MDSSYQHKFAKIDDYLLNRLSEAEEKAFELCMMKNPALFEEVKMRDTLVSLLKAQVSEDVCAKPVDLQAVLNCFFKTSFIESPSTWISSGVAAAVVLTSIILSPDAIPFFKEYLRFHSISGLMKNAQRFLPEFLSIPAQQVVLEIDESGHIQLNLTLKNENMKLLAPLVVKVFDEKNQMVIDNIFKKYLFKLPADMLKPGMYICRLEDSLGQIINLGRITITAS